MKTQSIESRCYRTGKHTVCRRVRASFSPEILQAGQGAVEGLTVRQFSQCCWNLRVLTTDLHGQADLLAYQCQSERVRSSKEAVSSVSLLNNTVT